MHSRAGRVNQDKVSHTRKGAGSTLDCAETAFETHDLYRDWKELEQWACPSIFLSWQWIGVWCSVYQPDVRVLRVTDHGRLVGLGLITESDERRHGILVSRCLHLHQTGRPSQDHIWIEYNGFLAGQGYESAVAQTSVDYLKRTWTNWDELVIGAVEAGYANALAEATALTPHVRWEAPCFGIDLALLRREGQSCLDSLSGNTRHQIRRTLRLYEQVGEVRLERPKTLDEAEFLWGLIAPYHIARWGSGSGESGFANPEFVRFHRQYIRTNWKQGGADLIALRAGEETVAIFYNLVYRNRVYFYLAGIRQESDNRLKPGLLGHSLAVEDYMDRGFDYYDFMGGEERYKSQLGVRHKHLVQIGLQRNRWKLRAERAVRLLKKAGMRHENTGSVSSNSVSRR
ncbi:GNAT family N-acetyltransferase [Marinobacter changyiensis]|uniref:GNAT family N-acetyltransferase n=1 Tax=Marinobacter changyiensis TaxID=2604091 RepID=UPI0012646B39|nr:GNAT family N-acetyltransferase [Marinobacter changyiensis]